LAYAVLSDPLYLQLSVVVIIKGELTNVTFTVVILSARKDGMPKEHVKFAGRDMKRCPFHSMFI
jgi:hypothetical protein